MIIKGKALQLNRFGPVWDRTIPTDQGFDIGIRDDWGGVKLFGLISDNTSEPVVLLDEHAVRVLASAAGLWSGKG